MNKETRHSNGDCRSEIGITVGVVDSIITLFKLLNERDLTDNEVIDSLKDLNEDESIRKFFTEKNKNVITEVIRKNNKGNMFISVKVEKTCMDTVSNLFSYFTDELSFKDEELIGLTLNEALELFKKKDMEYLQS